MKCLAFSAVLVAGTVVAADPSATINRISRDDVTGQITVTYTLSDSDAIVTLDGDAATADGSWTKLGDSAFRRVVGDVNRQVLASETEERTICWTPDARDSESCAAGFRARLTLWSPSAPPDFMSAEIGGRKELRYYASKEALPYPVADQYWKTERLLFRKVPAKGVVWNMASVSPSRYVRLNYDYYLAVHLYTKAQAQAVLALDTERKDAIAEDADFSLCPQFRVSYDAWRGDDPDGRSAVYPIAASCEFATVRGMIALDVDFPTEAEWEYAARAGSGGALYTDEAPTSANVRKIAWFADDGGKLHEAGVKLGNRWGFHDVLGNVNEWCLDYYAPASNDYFKDGTRECPAENPTGPSEAQVVRSGTITRVTRGYYYANSLSDLANGLNGREGNVYKGLASPSLGVRFCAPIPGATADKIQNWTSRRISLDTSEQTAYWDCSAYENPAVIEVEQELTDTDCRRCTTAASDRVEPTGLLDSVFCSFGLSNLSRLISWPPTGMSIFVR